MRRLGSISAALAVLAAVFVTGCSTSGYDRTVTSSIAPVQQRTMQRQNSDLVTNDRTGYVSRRVVR